jgi:hypothetical protein
MTSFFPTGTFLTVHFVALFLALHVKPPTRISVKRTGDLLLVLALTKFTSMFTLPLEDPCIAATDTILG